ncbi:MAG: hypothetical protein ACQXXH_08565, partial [Candidatus Bathyarchaeia archaeon]
PERARAVAPGRHPRVSLRRACARDAVNHCPLSIGSLSFGVGLGGASPPRRSGSPEGQSPSGCAADLPPSA